MQTLTTQATLSLPGNETFLPISKSLKLLEHYPNLFEVFARLYRQELSFNPYASAIDDVIYCLIENSTDNFQPLSYLDKQVKLLIALSRFFKELEADEALSYQLLFKKQLHQ